MGIARRSLCTMVTAGCLVLAATSGRAADFATAYAHARAGTASLDDMELLALGGQAGDPEASFYLGLLFEQGRTLPRDPRRGFEWLWRSAIGGMPGALERTRAAFRRLAPGDRARVRDDVIEALFPDPGSGSYAGSRRFASRRPGGRAGKPANAQMIGVAAEIVREARRTRVPPALALAVATVESRFRPEAESPKGARGVMQIMPSTAAGVFDLEPDALWDVRTNVAVGIRFLDNLLARYGAIEPALAHYVGGGRAPGWLETGESPEVSAYVARVMDYYELYRARGF